ncbi:SDR family oxidoreductase [Aeromicrobium panaciterrae]|uniref:SDR family oxidoreductase n=1 Tax=Aeromicrobium panaciterrae TaxID=363861 RepID=UPI003CD0AE51
MSHAHSGEPKPSDRAATLEEIVDWVLWLCSNRSAYVVGHDLVIDGGLPNVVSTDSSNLVEWDQTVVIVERLVDPRGSSTSRTLRSFRACSTLSLRLRCTRSPCARWPQSGTSAWKLSDGI